MNRCSLPSDSGSHGHRAVWQEAKGTRLGPPDLPAMGTVSWLPGHKPCHGWDTDLLAFQAEWLAVLGRGIGAQVSVLPIQTWLRCTLLWAGGEGQVQLA